MFDKQTWPELCRWIKLNIKTNKKDYKIWNFFDFIKPDAYKRYLNMKALSFVRIWPAIIQTFKKQGFFQAVKTLTKAVNKQMFLMQN